MKAPLSKKRAKTRPSARLLIEELEARMAPAGVLTILGVDGIGHTTTATEENLGAFELRTLQRYTIKVGANGIGPGVNQLEPGLCSRLCGQCHACSGHEYCS